MAKNSGWCSALKEREKISLGLREVFLVRRWTDTCERDSQTHTAAGQVRDIQNFQRIEEGKIFFWCTSNSKRYPVVHLVAGRGCPKTLAFIQSHESTFHFLYSSIDLFIHSSNLSIHSVSPAVKSLQSFSCNVLAKPLMTWQTLTRMWSRIFSFRYLLIHKSTPQKEDVGDQRGAKNGRTPMWWDVSFSWLSSPKVLLPGIKSTLDKQHPLAGQTNFSADVNKSLVCLFNFTDVMIFPTLQKLPSSFSLISNSFLFWTFRRVPLKKL